MCVGLSVRDFNLDEKIEALPSLSLEEFQLKKKARKKRNPSNSSSKKTIAGSVPTTPAASTRLRAASLDTQHTGESTEDGEHTYLFISDSFLIQLHTVPDVVCGRVIN
jgi:hypothetical protein